MIERANTSAASHSSWKPFLKLDITTVSGFICLHGSDEFCGWWRLSITWLKSKEPLPVWVNFWITSESYLKLPVQTVQWRSCCKWSSKLIHHKLLLGTERWTHLTLPDNYNVTSNYTCVKALCKPRSFLLLLFTLFWLDMQLRTFLLMQLLLMKPWVWIW